MKTHDGREYDFIVIGRGSCPYTQKAVSLLRKNKSSFIYHEKQDLSPNNWDRFDSNAIFAANLMSKGKAQFYNKVPMIFVREARSEGSEESGSNEPRSNEPEKYDFLENGSASLEELFSR